MQTPTISRHVWYWPSANDVNHLQDKPMTSYSDKQAFDGVVCHVWGPNCVNLRVTDHAGIEHIRTSVRLCEDEDIPIGSNYATWMPYQKAQFEAQKPTTLADITLSDIAKKPAAVEIHSDPACVFVYCPNPDDCKANGCPNKAR